MTKAIEEYLSNGGKVTICRPSNKRPEQKRSPLIPQTERSTLVITKAIPMTVTIRHLKILSFWKQWLRAI